MDFSPQGYNPDGTAVFANDQQLLVKFYKHPQISKHKSDAAGLPIYDDVEMISVIQPGEQNEIKQLANDMHKKRFPKQYEGFLKGQEQSSGGTPLDHLFPSEPSTIMTLKSFHVFSVQQLSAITDSAMAQLPFGRTLVDRAKAYLSSASGGQNFHAMQNAMEKRIKDLEGLLLDKGESLPPVPVLNLPDEQLPPSKRRGRPRKTVETTNVAS